MTTSRRWLFKVGYGVLFAPVGLAVILVVLHSLGAINAWGFPLVHVGVFCLFGGSSCLVAAQFVGRRPAQRVAASQRRWLGWGLAILLVINVPTYGLAYQMTHVRAPGQLGIGVPKPKNAKTPSDRGLSYATRTIPISSSQWLETWEISAEASTPRGTVLLFPGNLGTKSSQLISPAQTFSSLGFDTVLVDFRGVGGSSGSTVTLGIDESEDVVTVYNYWKEQQGRGDAPIILYGVSMGSAAILRAIATHKINPDAIILELPFVRLVDAVKSRLRHHKIPTNPTAALMVFWAGIQHGVNGFGHNPISYAKAVDCPALVIHGAQDKWTPVDDIESLVNNIPASKQLVVSPEAGHHQLIGVDRPLWDASVSNFLKAI
ncbi:alpha/beta fold hydrolase [Leptolyngbya cf. ectocarpi LEGE 11479]|uniref:Alpha/beta fold hydrolase n=1 Tax=Leptolyngbya cf. ectocarpi LEGE 11479 TaxID=1828722 RepID=A0A928WZR8_LEPEC|nr:alpha/beta fold hydrolase [Leptolyngbya ectocarpi]MBE9066435.1 alpha/beta fold hydrolase [Leptolyngbya cf. ectocarpi LEGE 11479]